MKQSTQMEKRNDPNVNFGMYQLDREAKRQAQPLLPSIRQSDEDERRTFDSEDIEDWQHQSERQGAE